MSYLLVDAADDSVLAEYESLGELVRIMQRFQKVLPQREVVVVRFDEHSGELVGTESSVTAHALSDWEGFALFGR